jgi:hypothetical protein
MAINVFKETETAKRNALLLTAQVAVIDARLAWIESVRPTVARADDRQAGFARALPKLRTALRRELKTGDFITARGQNASVPIGTLRGSAFVGGIWRLSDKLDGAKASLDETRTEAGVSDWAEGLSPALRVSKLGELRLTEKALNEVAAKVSAAAAFVSQANVETLTTWAKSGHAPLDFKLTRTARSFDLIVADRRWQCGIADIAPLPLLPVADEEI